MFWLRTRSVIMIWVSTIAIGCMWFLYISCVWLPLVKSGCHWLNEFLSAAWGFYQLKMFAICDMWLLLVTYRKIGPRSHVWSEKEMVNQAAFEFSEVASRWCYWIGPTIATCVRFLSLFFARLKPCYRQRRALEETTYGVCMTCWFCLLPFPMVVWRTLA